MDARFTGMLKPFLPHLNDRPITPDISLRQYGLDSMQAIELMFAVEDTFGVELTDELLTDETFGSAGALWEAVQSLTGVRTAS
ncbi:Phosphopantetheine attachment site [Lentzea aerocolonigenes]|nr:Phosphopantetheine attachment site [Lentzea aerocolonigenes]